MIFRVGGGGPSVGTPSSCFAVIHCDYPSGSTCTCTSGSTVYTAPDTTGKVNFLLPSSGTWVVKSTTGSRTAQKSISITTKGQENSVTLAYELILLNGTTIASGYSLGAGSFKDGYLSLPQSTFCYIKPAVDLSLFNKLQVTGKSTWAMANGYYASGGAYSNTSGTAISTASFDFGSDNTKTIDISTITQNGYIGGKGGGGSSGYISKIVLST